MIFKIKYPSEGRLYYLCHPFTSYGSMHENKTKADMFENKLKHRGISVINTLSLPLGPTEPEAMEQCMKLLSACKGIILCPDWCRSTGCKVEFDYAVKNNLEIIEIERD